LGLYQYYLEFATKDISQDVFMVLTFAKHAKRSCSFVTFVVKNIF